MGNIMGRIAISYKNASLARYLLGNSAEIASAATVGAVISTTYGCS
jgi:hypothetical protein